MAYPFENFYKLKDNLPSYPSSGTEPKRGNTSVPSVPGGSAKVTPQGNSNASLSINPLYTGHINAQLVGASVGGNVATSAGEHDMNWESSRFLDQSSGHNSSGGLLLSHRTNENPSVGGYQNLNLNNYTLPVVPTSGINRYASNISDDFALPGENFMRSMIVEFNKEYGDLIRARNEKPNENVIPFAPPYGNTNFALHYENEDSDAYRPVPDPSYIREAASMGYNFFQGAASSGPEVNNSPIQTHALNTSVGNFSRYMPLNEHQNPVQASGVLAWNNAVGSGTYPTVTGAPINPDTGKIKDPKRKRSRTPKEPAPVFPSNVKGLLSTGIFDGLPVKYVAWSRDKLLRGVINGTGYICSCDECNNLKIINAYEFEQHAGCKTKHPNNHIYFESGKTVYAVVLELRRTPPRMLLETIQTISGSPVHRENFHAFKVQYEAIEDELDRIYQEKEAMKSSGDVCSVARSG